MKENKLTTTRALRWKQFNHKSYSVFCSLKREVNIGVLAVTTLTFANVENLSTAHETPFQLKSYEHDEIEGEGTHVMSAETVPAMQLATLSRTDTGATTQHRFKSSIEKAENLNGHHSDVPKMIPIKLLLYGRCTINPHASPPQFRFYFIISIAATLTKVVFCHACY